MLCENINLPKEYTYFLIDLLINCNPLTDIVSLVELVLVNVDALDPHVIHMALALIEYNDYIRYEVFKLLDKCIEALTTKDLALMLQCFQKDEFKYEVFIKLIKRCLPADEYTEIILQFKNETMQIDVSNITRNCGPEYQLNRLVESIVNFDSNERLDLLEQSINNTGMRLENSENHCEQLRQILGDDYETGCEILGMNPDIYKEFI